MEDAPQNIRNFTTFFRAVSLFPSFYVACLGEENGKQLYETAQAWLSFTSAERREALRKAKEANKPASTQE